MEKMPEKFKTFEEMNTWLKKQRSSPANATKQKTTTSPTGKKRPTKRSTKTKVVKDTAQSLTAVANIEKPEMVYQSIHYYLRPADSWTQLLADAREELKYRNSNVLIFVHQHKFDEPCSETGSCRRMT